MSMGNVFSFPWKFEGDRMIYPSLHYAILESDWPYYFVCGVMAAQYITYLFVPLFYPERLVKIIRICFATVAVLSDLALIVLMIVACKQK